MEPYNAVLSIYDLIENTDLCLLMDNEAIYDVCRRSLQIELPNFTNINQIIAQNVSSLTSSLRFDGK